MNTTALYSFYLFSKLFDVIAKENYEYDLMFEEVKALYDEYLSSAFNDSTQPEYECMERFLEFKLINM